MRPFAVNSGPPLGFSLIFDDFDAFYCFWCSLSAFLRILGSAESQQGPAQGRKSRRRRRTAVPKPKEGREKQPRAVQNVPLRLTFVHHCNTFTNYVASTQEQGTAPLAFEVKGGKGKEKSCGFARVYRCACLPIKGTLTRLPLLCGAV